jgi:hypothetical protein
VSSIKNKIEGIKGQIGAILGALLGWVREIDI